MAARGRDDDDEIPLAGYVRRYQRGTRWLTALEIVHKVWGYLCLLVAVTTVGMAILDMSRATRRGSTPHPSTFGWLFAGLAGLLYVGLTFYSTHLIEHRKGRAFSLAWGAAHALTVVGLPLALLTWLGLTRASVRELYGDSPPNFPGNTR
jgi:hypothetical protein